MAFTTVSIDKFLELTALYPVLDVRAPAEYNQGHIPNSISFPLFTDEERAEVGTLYKQKSRQEAIKLGLDLFGPKMRSMLEEVENIFNSFVSGANKTVLLHCWRGGMRSSGVAWVLDFYGFNVITLEGGYKSFRNWVLAQVTNEYNINILGGYTGSGKTELLAELKSQGESILDLEFLASHKGSTFGSIGMPNQPSQEMFENKLAMELVNLRSKESKKSIWVEDESQRIGHLFIPKAFWESMLKSTIYFLEIPFEERLDYIVNDYGRLDKSKLLDAIKRIEKRLGGLETKNATSLLESGDIKACFSILLKYYDRWYLKALEKKADLKSQLFKISCDKIDSEINAKKLLSLSEN